MSSIPGSSTETELENNNIHEIEGDSKDSQVKDEADQVFDFLEKTRFLELIESDSDNFDTWLQNTPNERLLRYTTILNNVLSGKHISNRDIAKEGNYIGSLVGGKHFLAPDTESKLSLFNKSLDTIKALDNNQDRALLAYYTLQNLHLYTDANGRTGRLLFSLLNSVGKGLKVEEVRDIITHQKSETAGRVIFKNKVLRPQDVNRFVNKELFRELRGHEIAEKYRLFTAGIHAGDVKLPEKYRNLVPTRKLKKVEDILGENHTRDLVLLELINRYPDLEQFVVLKEAREYMGVAVDPLLKINADKLIESDLLTRDRLVEITEIHKELKKKQIAKLLDIFEHPQKYTTTNKNGEEVPIKDLFLIKD
ncbi:TPA: hypothetical protein GX533_00650 [Candidatus Dojkabacteria bacterium]|uniref:Fido domain-containing protein n=1 Tax=Candidatus Dojkabacteria bacterium TaxID=2099670 RepID=A0A832RCA0_9BACT|nr:hypothetical protein [Candidatus Dojkabacteria bacterium]